MLATDTGAGTWANWLAPHGIVPVAAGDGILDDGVGRMATELLTNTVRQAILTIRDPKAGLRSVMAYGLGNRALVETAALVAILGAIVAALMLEFTQAEPDDMVLAPARSPIVLAAFQLATIFVSAYLLYFVGRLFGGDGTFGECLTASIWLQVILLLVQILQFALMFILPFLATLAYMAAIVLVVYLSVSFVKEVHGFRSLFAVSAGVVGTMFVLAMIIAFLMASFGIVPQQGF